MKPVCVGFLLFAFAGPLAGDEGKEDSYAKFLQTAKEVEPIRKKRLIGEAEFLKKSKDPETIVLDCRSEKKFRKCHIVGSVNLPFSEINRASLRKLISDEQTRILIYCDNNLVEGKKEDRHKEGDDSSSAGPSIETNSGERAKIEAIRGFIYLEEYDPPEIPKDPGFELNIATFVTLYGYGYKNI